jgi:phosphomannomutase
MSRPAAAVHRVIKAYDVRGLVGDEIDESLAADVGAAFARLTRDEGAMTCGTVRRRWQLRLPPA